MKANHIQMDRAKGKNLNAHKIFTFPVYPKTAKGAMENPLVNTSSLRYNPFIPGKWPPPSVNLGIKTLTF